MEIIIERLLVGNVDRQPIDQGAMVKNADLSIRFQMNKVEAESVTIEKRVHYIFIWQRCAILPWAAYRQP